MILAGLLLGLWVQPAFAQEDGSEASPGIISVGGIVLFYNSSGPLSFVSMTVGELPKGAVPTGTVQGRTCQYGISIPIEAALRPTSLSGAAGNGGYRKTLEAMRREHPELSGIFDVKVDLHILSVLGIYKRQCTEILARGFRQEGGKP